MSLQEMRSKCCVLSSVTTDQMGLEFVPQEPVLLPDDNFFYVPQLEFIRFLFTLSWLKVLNFFEIASA